MFVMPASIFISYRRSDSSGHAGRLHDRLMQWFDHDVVFYDTDTIEAGDVLPERIEAALCSAQVVLVLIGPDWLTELNRRAALPQLDYVRLEVAFALRRQIGMASLKIIPVLLGGARPVATAEALHENVREDLQRLCLLDAHEFQGKNRDWNQQFVALRQLIANAPGMPTPRYRAPASESKLFRVIPHLLSPHFRDPNGALACVRRQLQTTQHAAIVVPAALYGMGGVGKTQLALKYSHEYRDSYAGVWWFRAETEVTLQSDARDTCQATGVSIAEGELPTTAIMRWLERQQQPWLLVFDNVEYDQGGKHATLPASFLQLRYHHALITSRYPAWGGIAEAIELTTWSDAEGADFLSARLPRAPRANLQRLSRLLGGLPLALEQAAAFLDERGGLVADYCTQIEGVDSSALMLDHGSASTRYERTVFSTLSLSFQRLTPAAQQLLRLCAFFSAEPIPERYFREGADHLPLELAQAARSTLSWEQVAGELRSFGIAERQDIPSLDRAPGQSDDKVEKSLVLHRLTLEVARHTVGVATEDGPRAQRLLRAQCPNDTLNPQQWPRYVALQPHVMHLDRLRPKAWLDRRMHSWMLGRVANHLRDAKALFGAAERLLRTAIEMNQADLGAEHPDTLSSIHNLAETLLVQGKLPAARLLQEQVLEICRRMAGEEHPATLSSMNNLALTLLDQGELPTARALQEQVLTIRRRTQGEDHSDTLTSMNNLAETLRAQGDLRAARVLQERVLSICRRQLGEEHPDTLGAIHNLAETLQTQGELPTARRLQEQVLAGRRRVLGEEHLYTLRSMNNLAITLESQGELPSARALQEEVLAVRRRVLGEQHPDTLTSMNNLAITLLAQGKLSAARALQEQVLATLQHALGEEHPDTLISKHNLVETLQAQGEIAAARAFEEQVLTARRRVLGEEHPHTLSSIHSLAEILRAEGKLPAARALQEQVLEVRRRVLGEEHPDTLSSIHNLAETLRAQGDLLAARALQEQVLAVRRRILGDEHPNTLRSMNNLAETLRAQGQLLAARALQEQVLAIRRRILGAEHPDTLRSMNNLAETLRAQGELSAARILQEQVLAISRRVLGQEHPDTLRSMNNLAPTLRAQGELPAARALQEQVLMISRRVLGEEHPATLSSMNNLAETLLAQGELPTAMHFKRRR
jgi:hypothetical protein